MNEAMYWNGTGKYEALNEKLEKFIPVSGSVVDPLNNRKLEKFRKASNCYYDLYNNGLCNRAKEFRQVFGFGGTSIAQQGFPSAPHLEEAMDKIILDAAKEQNISL